MTYDERYKSYLAIIEPALKKYFGARRGFEFDGLLDAMDYSLTAGGKRIRPVLVLEFARLNGLEPEKALPAACAVEMLHTYSLIHDDLPCMDNDDLRRGKPTNHKVFGESTAVLAGDALQAEAFGAILRSALPVEARARCAEILAGAAGVDGICGGQFMDLSAEGHALSAEELSALQGRKTGALLSAACMLGAAAAGADGPAVDTRFAIRRAAWRRVPDTRRHARRAEHRRRAGQAHRQRQARRQDHLHEPLRRGALRAHGRKDHRPGLRHGRGHGHRRLPHGAG